MTECFEWYLISEGAITHTLGEECLNYYLIHDIPLAVCIIFIYITEEHFHSTFLEHLL